MEGGALAGGVKVEVAFSWVYSAEEEEEANVGGLLLL
jgi:hypothetical protein